MSSYYEKWNREKNSNAGRSVVAMAREANPDCHIFGHFDGERSANVHSSYKALPGSSSLKPGFLLHDVLTKGECDALIR